MPPALPSPPPAPPFALLPSKPKPQARGCAFFFRLRPACLFAWLCISQFPASRLILECAIVPGVHSNTPVVLCSVSCESFFSFLLPLPSSSPSPAATVEYGFFSHCLSVWRIRDDSFDPCILAHAPLFFSDILTSHSFFVPTIAATTTLYCSATLRLRSFDARTRASSLSTPANSIHSFLLC